VIRTGLRPIPPTEQRIYELSDGHWIAIVRVHPHPDL
jgi:hypothetical protein